MIKINREKYEVLKELNGKWKWIARDEDKSLWVFAEKPVKKYDSSPCWDTETRKPYSVLELSDEIHLFQFIQWEDAEPYEIAELIEEYETHEFVKINQAGRERLDKLYGNKSEETEVKCVENVIEFIESDINLIEEKLPKMDREKSEGRKEWHEGYLTAMLEVKNKLDQLDKTEVLSPEWIGDNEYRVIEYPESVVPSKKLQNLIVPKQDEVDRAYKDGYEKGKEHATKVIIPTIPKFIAEVIEEHKELGYDVYDSIDLIIETNGEGLPSISDWVAINIDKYARAWLAYPNIEVEKEQKYVVKIPTNENNDIPYAIVSDSGDIWIDALPSKYKLTEEEIRGLTKGDVLFEHFAVKVEVWDE